MKENVRRTILDSDIQGIKLHLMHLMRKTRMLRDYHEGRLQLMSRPDYVNVICDQLEMIPKEIIIHRLTGMRRGFLDWTNVELEKMGSLECN